VVKAPLKPALAKRGCLWYVGVAIAGIFGLLMLLVAAVVVTVHNGNSRTSTVVSAAAQTSLEVETSNHGEGFLDGYDWLEVYYVRSGWIWNKRVRVYNIPHASASHTGFRRLLNDEGKLQIEIKVKYAGASGDSIVVATFIPPTSFPDE